MALIDKASLLMVPSTYEDGTLYNVLPSGNKAPDETGNHNGYDQTRADFSFSRGSNLSATRIGPSGLIEKGRENLLLQSNTFSQSWVNTRSSESSGFEGYDGTNNAWKLKEDNNNGTHKIVQSITQTGVVTASLYAKAGERSAVQFIIESGGSYAGVNFDLTDGSVQSSPAATFTLIDSNSIDVGNGWYRLIFAANITSSASFSIYTLNSSFSTSYQGTTGEGVYIQNAQLEYGLAASSYLDSGATTATAGVLENTPRIDYSSGAGALLLEPQRTNLYTHSEYYDSYTKVNLSVTTNAITSPEGIQNASKLVSDNSGPNIKRIQPSISTTGTNEYIISAFVKKAEWDYFFIYGAGTLVNGAQAIFNLNTGTIEEGSGHSTMEVFGDDGWYKITWKTTSTGTGTGNPRIGITDNANSSSSNGDGVSGVYLYGLQIEEASHPSSYVPTYGSAATRGADLCNSGGSAESINSTEGVLYAEISGLSNDTARLSISDGTNNNNIYIELDSSNVNAVGRVGGSNQFALSSSQTITNNNKVAVKYKANDFALYVNGTEVATDTSGSTYSANTLTSIQFNRGDGGVLFYGNVKQVAVFNEALSDSELATLTTL